MRGATAGTTACSSSASFDDAAAAAVAAACFSSASVAAAAAVAAACSSSSDCSLQHAECDRHNGIWHVGHQSSWTSQYTTGAGGIHWRWATRRRCGGFAFRRCGGFPPRRRPLGRRRARVAGMAGAATAWCLLAFRAKFCDLSGQNSMGDAPGWSGWPQFQHFEIRTEKYGE